LFSGLVDGLIFENNRVMLLDLLAKNEVDVIAKMTIQDITDGGYYRSAKTSTKRLLRVIRWFS
jgi:hypothetical protein